MKRNDLLAKSLTLGLAVATAAASMSVPAAAETIQAEEQTSETSMAAETAQTVNAGGGRHVRRRQRSLMRRVLHFQ